MLQRGPADHAGSTPACLRRDNSCAVQVGWTPKIKGYPLGENFANTFRVEDGVMKVSYDGYNSFDNKFGHIFYKDKFSHYRLRVE